MITVALTFLTISLSLCLDMARKFIILCSGRKLEVEVGCTVAAHTVAIQVYSVHSIGDGAAAYTSAGSYVR